MPTITITVYERTCASEDFDSESGQGMPDDADVREIGTNVLACSPYVSEEGIDAMVAEVLEDHSVGEWDGGNTAYDPDGARMLMNGTVRERFARIVRT